MMRRNKIESATDTIMQLITNGIDETISTIREVVYIENYNLERKYFYIMKVIYNINIWIVCIKVRDVQQSLYIG